MNHHNMTWARLISPMRLGMEQPCGQGEGSRTLFQRDYDRIVFSSPFRRLQNKTQVFPLPGHIFVHNRLTHSLEVGSVGRSMAGCVAEALMAKYAGAEWTGKLHHLSDIVGTACLCHDLGNPPFGHSGEKAIATFFSEGEGRVLKDKLSPVQWADVTHFEGNANSLRLLSHQFAGRRPGGFAMTYSSLAAIVKYPHNSLHAGEKGKFGFFDSEATTWRRIASHLGIPALDGKGEVYARHPLVYLVEGADDICYQIMDIEDAHKLKILSHADTVDLLAPFAGRGAREHLNSVLAHVTDPNEQVAYLRSKAIGALTRACVEEFMRGEEQMLRGEYNGTLIANMADAEVRSAYEVCSQAAYAHIYRAREVVEIELAGHRIITDLLDRLLRAVMNPGAYASQLLLHRVPPQYQTDAPTLYGKVQSILDHVSAMTDVYALDLFRKLNGSSLPDV